MSKRKGDGAGAGAGPSDGKRARQQQQQQQQQQTSGASASAAAPHDGDDEMDAAAAPAPVPSIARPAAAAASSAQRNLAGMLSPPRAAAAASSSNARSPAPRSPAPAAAASSSGAGASAGPAGGAASADSDSDDSSDDDDDDAVAATSGMARLHAIQQHIRALEQRMQQTAQATGVDVAVAGGLLSDALRGLSTRQVVGLLANTGVGKSFLINLLLFLTAEEATYEHVRGRPAGYVFEALAELTADEQQRLLRYAIVPGSHNYNTMRQRVVNGADGQPAEREPRFEQMLRSACHTPVNGQESVPWLLPTARSSAVRPTTPFVVRIRHGRTFHMVAEFFTEDELKQAAFRFIENKGFRGDDGVAAMEAERFTALTGVPAPEFGKKAAKAAAAAASSSSSSSARLLPTRWQDVVLSHAVLAAGHPGRAVLWHGNGALHRGDNSDHFHMDRVYIRDALAKLQRTPADCHSIKQLTIYVPSALLSFGIELHDIPGSNDATRTKLTHEAIRAVDMLVVLSHQTLVSDNAVKAALKDSQFVDEALLSKSRHGAQLHVLFSPETKPGCAVAPSSMADASKESSFAADAAEAAQYNQNAVRKLAEGDDDDDEEEDEEEEERVDRALAERVHYGAIRPLAFASLALNLPERRNVFKQGDSFTQAQMTEWMEATGMPRLLSSIAELSINNAQRTLQYLSQEGEEEPPQQPQQAAASSLSAASAARAASSSSSGSDSWSDSEDEDTVLELGSVSSVEVIPEIQADDEPHAVRLLARELQLRMSHFAESPRITLARQAVNLLGSALKPRSGGRLPPVLKMHLDQLRDANHKAADLWMRVVQQGATRDAAAHCMNNVVSRLCARAANFKNQRSLFTGVLSNLRQALDETVGKLLEPLRIAVLRSLEECVQRVCAGLFPSEQLSPLALQLAQTSLRALTANPLRHLIAHGGSQEKLEGNALANYFRDEVWQLLQQSGDSKLTAASAAPLLSLAVSRLLDTIVKRAGRRMKAFHEHVFITVKGRACVMQQIMMQFLRQTALMAGENGEQQEAQRELRLASRFLNKWRMRADRMLQLQQQAADENREKLQRDIITNLARRELNSAIRRTAAWLADSPHPSRRQLRNLCILLATRSPRTDKKVRAELKLKLAAQAKRPAGPPPQPQAMRPPQHARLRARLAALQPKDGGSGFDIVDVPADGSCLFSALAHQLALVTAQLPRAGLIQRYRSDQLRALAVQQLLCRFLTETEQARFLEREQEDVLSYCQRMRESSQWGGYNELQELANYFNINIQVHFGGPYNSSFVVHSDRCGQPAPMLHIAFVNSAGDESTGAVLNHYLSVVPKAFPKPRR